MKSRSTSALGSDSGELPPVIDVEDVRNMDAQNVVDAVETWLHQVESAVGRAPIIYLSPSVGLLLNLPAGDSRYPLWIANYDVACPAVPPPWHTWSFWQQTNRGFVTGINGEVDLDFMLPSSLTAGGRPLVIAEEER